jgi:hypothetical protein
MLITVKNAGTVAETIAKPIIKSRVQMIRTLFLAIKVRNSVFVERSSTNAICVVARDSSTPITAGSAVYKRYSHATRANVATP